MLEVQPFQLHGMPYVDVTVAFRDRSVEHARLGAESVPDHLEAGEKVLASIAANMVVAITRPDSSDGG